MSVVWGIYYELLCDYLVHSSISSYLSGQDLLMKHNGLLEYKFFLTANCNEMCPIMMIQQRKFHQSPHCDNEKYHRYNLRELPNLIQLQFRNSCLKYYTKV